MSYEQLTLHTIPSYYRKGCINLMVDGMCYLRPDGKIILDEVSTYELIDELAKRGVKVNDKE